MMRTTMPPERKDTLQAGVVPTTLDSITHINLQGVMGQRHHLSISSKNTLLQVKRCIGTTKNLKPHQLQLIHTVCNNGRLQAKYLTDTMQTRLPPLAEKPHNQIRDAPAWRRRGKWWINATCSTPSTLMTRASNSSIPRAFDTTPAKSSGDNQWGPARGK